MQTDTRERPYMHIKEAAAEVDVHPSTVGRAIHARELAAVRLGPNGRYRVWRRALTEWLRPAGRS